MLWSVGQDGGELHGEGDLAEVLGLAGLHQGDDQVLLLVDVGLAENDLSLAHEVVPQAPVVVVHLIDISSGHFIYKIICPAGLVTQLRYNVVKGPRPWIILFLFWSETNLDIQWN